MSNALAGGDAWGQNDVNGHLNKLNKAERLLRLVLTTKQKECRGEATKAQVQKSRKGTCGVPYAAGLD